MYKFKRGDAQQAVHLQWNEIQKDQPVWGLH